MTGQSNIYRTSSISIAAVEGGMKSGFSQTCEGHEYCSASPKSACMHLVLKVVRHAEKRSGLCSTICSDLLGWINLFAYWWRGPCTKKWESRMVFIGRCVCVYMLGKGIRFCSSLEKQLLQSVKCQKRLSHNNSKPPKKP